MDIVVLGGTGFLSRQVVREALRRGHTVAALTRGARGIPPDGAKDLRADRDSAESLATALQGLHPGAVIDCSGYTVEGAQNAAGCLAGVRSYVYVSSLNAYRSWPPGPIRGEDEPLWAEGEGNRSDYGPTKAASERILSAALGDRLLTVRAGLIIGPGDDTGRMTSWLQRIAAGGRVIVPDCLNQPMAFVDVRDLAAWLVSAVEPPLVRPGQRHRPGRDDHLRPAPTSLPRGRRRVGRAPGAAARRRRTAAPRGGGPPVAGTAVLAATSDRCDRLAGRHQQGP